MPSLKTIPIPLSPGPGASALRGISLMAIDTDPDELLGAALSNLRTLAIEILAVIPTTFRGQPGYVIVSRNPRESR